MLTIKNGKTIWILPTMLVVGMMLLSACGGAAQTQAPDPMDDASQVSSTQAPDADNPTDAVSSPNTGSGAAISFKDDVMPILQSRCVKCHGGERTEKKFDLTTYAHLMAGSENGAVIVAGDAANSKLLQLVEQGKMPKRSAKLLPAQIQTLVDWINQGAQNN